MRDAGGADVAVGLAVRCLDGAGPREGAGRPVGPDVLRPGDRECGARLIARDLLALTETWAFSCTETITRTTTNPAILFAAPPGLSS